LNKRESPQDREAAEISSKRIRRRVSLKLPQKEKAHYDYEISPGLETSLSEKKKDKFQREKAQSPKAENVLENRGSTGDKKR